MCLASCHSLTTINNVLTGDPLDAKMFEGTGKLKLIDIKYGRILWQGKNVFNLGCLRGHYLLVSSLSVKGEELL